MRIMSYEDATILLLSLHTLENLLKAGQDCFISIKYFGVNEISLKFHELGGIDILEKLQTHKNSKVYDKAVEIMTEFYGVEDETEMKIQAENEVPRFVFT